MTPRIVTLLGTAPVPADEEEILAWLTDGERSRLAGLAVGKRRADWLLGRLTAKRLVRGISSELAGRELGLEEIEIDAEAGGSPYARLLSGERLPVALTISHSHGSAFCAALPGPAAVLGGDLEWIEPRSAAFVRDFFTPAEAAALEKTRPHDRPLVANAIWSAKEAALKALGLGLTADTRDVAIALSDAPSESPLRPVEGDWRRFDAACAPRLGAGERPFEGLWRTTGDFVATLAARI